MALVRVGIVCCFYVVVFVIYTVFAKAPDSWSVRGNNEILKWLMERILLDSAVLTRPAPMLTDKLGEKIGMCIAMKRSSQCCKVLNKALIFFLECYLACVLLYFWSHIGLQNIMVPSEICVTLYFDTSLHKNEYAEIIISIPIWVAVQL